MSEADRRNSIAEAIIDAPRSIVNLVSHQPAWEPSSELAAKIIEILDPMVQSIDDLDRRRVVSLRLENKTDSEVADQLGCSWSTVQ